MATPIRMPQPGQMTEECTVLRWYKREGDPVVRGDALFEIETDKSNMDVEAYESGTLLSVRVAEGRSVRVVLPRDHLRIYAAAGGDGEPR